MQQQSRIVDRQRGGDENRVCLIFLCYWCIFEIRVPWPVTTACNKEILSISEKTWQFSNEDGKRLMYVVHTMMSCTNELYIAVTRSHSLAGDSTMSAVSVGRCVWWWPISARRDRPEHSGDQSSHSKTLKERGPN
jgi:hypothetical protein